MNDDDLWYDEDRLRQTLQQYWDQGTRAPQIVKNVFFLAEDEEEAIESTRLFEPRDFDGTGKDLYGSAGMEVAVTSESLLNMFPWLVPNSLTWGDQTVSLLEIGHYMKHCVEETDESVKEDPVPFANKVAEQFFPSSDFGRISYFLSKCDDPLRWAARLLLSLTRREFSGEYNKLLRSKLPNKEQMLYPKGFGKMAHNSEGYSDLDITFFCCLNTLGEDGAEGDQTRSHLAEIFAEWGATMTYTRQDIVWSVMPPTEGYERIPLKRFPFPFDASIRRRERKTGRMLPVASPVYLSHEKEWAVLSVPISYIRTSDLCVFWDEGVLSTITVNLRLDGTAECVVVSAPHFPSGGTYRVVSRYAPTWSVLDFRLAYSHVISYQGLERDVLKDGFIAGRPHAVSRKHACHMDDWRGAPLRWESPKRCKCSPCLSKPGYYSFGPKTWLPQKLDKAPPEGEFEWVLLNYPRTRTLVPKSSQTSLILATERVSHKKRLFSFYARLWVREVFVYCMFVGIVMNMPYVHKSVRIPLVPLLSDWKSRLYWIADDSERNRSIRAVMKYMAAALVAFPTDTGFMVLRDRDSLHIPEVTLDKERSTSADIFSSLADIVYRDTGWFAPELSLYSPLLPPWELIFEMTTGEPKRLPLYGAPYFI